MRLAIFSLCHISAMTALPTRLPRLLSLLPRDGLNATVYQSRWHSKGLPTPATASSAEACRWEVKRVDLLLEPTLKAKAYGVLYWKGALCPELSSPKQGRSGLTTLRTLHNRQACDSSRQRVRTDQRCYKVQVAG